MMNRIVFKRVDEDGVASIGRLTFGNIVIETPAVLPAVRTVQNPNDLEFLIAQKAQNELTHIQGAVIRLYNAPVVLEPRFKQIKKQQRSATIDGKPAPRDPFTVFCSTNLLVCDPAMEYTRFTKSKYDEKFLKHLWFVSRLQRYFKEFEKRKEEKTMSVERLRKEMHDELWLGNSRTDRKERNEMIEQIMRYQLNYYPNGTPVCHTVETVDELKSAIEINDICQGIAYANESECLSYILFHKSAIKNDELMGKYVDYLRTNKVTKLDATKFRDLDLHCPVDYKARRAFIKLEKDIADLKQDQRNRAFMLLDAGTQHYVAMEVFDIVSTSLTGFDADIDGGKRKEGEPLTMHWWDERKMWARPTDGDAPIPNPEHCPACNLTQSFDIEQGLLNLRRRVHRSFELNDNASGICQAVRAKEVGIHMRKTVANAEFSYANDVILSP